MVADSRALFVINVLWKDSHVGLNKKKNKNEILNLVVIANDKFV